MPPAKEAAEKPTFISQFNWTHLIIAVATAIGSFMMSSGAYQSKIDTLISEKFDEKVAITQLSKDLNSLSLQVGRLTQQMEDNFPRNK